MTDAAMIDLQTQLRLMYDTWPGVRVNRPV